MTFPFSFFKNNNTAPPSITDIFGANVYAWWDANDLSTITQSGGLVDNVISKGTHPGLMESTGANRTILTSDPLVGRTGFLYDGVSDYFQEANSKDKYKFLHSGTGGTVITVFKCTVQPNVLDYLIGNAGGPIGFYLPYWSDDKVYTRIYGSGTVADVKSSNASAVNNINSFISIHNPSGAIVDRAEVIFNNVSTGGNPHAGTVNPVNSSYDLTMGKIASLATDVYNFKGLQYETYIIDRQATPTELTAVNTFLEYRYGSTFPIS